MIIRGNKQLAQAYALHINGVYDHYSWRGYLGSGGNPDQIYSLDGWKPGGGKEQELDFWMEEPVPPRPTRSGGSAAQQPSVASGASTKTAVKKTPKKATKKATKKAPKKLAKKVAKTSAKKSAKKAKASKPAKAKKTKAKKTKAGSTKKAKAKKAKAKK